MAGKRDTFFSKRVHDPLKGGITQLTFGGGLLPALEWTEEMDALEAEFVRWRDDVSGVGQGIVVNMGATHRETPGGQTPCAADPGGNSPEEPNAALLELKSEIQEMSRDLRETHVGFAIQPSTAAGCAAAVKSSAMLNKH